MKINRTVIKIESLILFVASLILFLVHIQYVSQLYMPYLNDDFGYWAGGYYITGINWSNMMFGVPYYSFGYGIVLAPLICIIKSPIVLYRVAVILNSVFIVIAFRVSIKISERIFPDVTSLKRGFFCFAIFTYSAFLCLSRIVFSEILLVMVVLLLVNEFMKQEEKATVIRSIIIAVLSSYSYIVHQRMLSMVVASVVIMFVLKLNKKIYSVHLGSFIAVDVVMLSVGATYKKVLQSDLWGTSAMQNDVNDYSVQLKKVYGILQGIGTKGLFIIAIVTVITLTVGVMLYKNRERLNYLYLSKKVFICFLMACIGIACCLIIIVSQTGEKNIVATLLKEMGGQLFYIGAATFGVVWCGVICVVEDIVAKTVEYKYTKAFVFLAFVCLFGISVVYYASTPDRIDQLVYGRYNEPVFGILLLFGFGWLCRKKWNKTCYCICMAVVMISLGYLVEKRIIILKYNSYPSISAAGLWWYYNEIGLDMIKIGMLCAGMMISLYVFLQMKKYQFNYVGLVMFVVLQYYLGSQTIIKNTLDSQYEYIRNEEVITRINSIDLPVYCLKSQDSTVYRWKNMYQFLYPKREVVYADMEEILKNNEEKFVVVNDKNDFWYSLGMGENYSLIAAENRYALYISNSVLEKYPDYKEYLLEIDDRVEIPLKLFRTKKSNIDERVSYIESTGKEGKLIYGLKQYAAVARYEVELEIELKQLLENIEGYSNIIATAKIMLDENVAKEVKISQDDLKEKSSILLAVDVMESGKKIGIEIECSDSAIIRINHVYARKQDIVIINKKGGFGK